MIIALPLWQAVLLALLFGTLVGLLVGHWLGYRRGREAGELEVNEYWAAEWNRRHGLLWQRAWETALDAISPENRRAGLVALPGGKDGDTAA